MRSLAFPLRHIVPPPRAFPRDEMHLFVLPCSLLHIDQVEQETALLKETVEGAAKVLAEAATTTKTATEASKQASATRHGRKVPYPLRASSTSMHAVLCEKYTSSISSAVPLAPTRCTCTPIVRAGTYLIQFKLETDGQNGKGPPKIRASVFPAHVDVFEAPRTSFFPPTGTP